MALVGRAACTPKPAWNLTYSPRAGRSGTPSRSATIYLCAEVRRAHDAGHFLIAEYRAVQNRHPTRIKFDENVKIRRASPEPRNAF